MDSFMGALREVRDAAAKEYGVGDEENRQVMRDARREKGQGVEAPKMAQMKDSYRTPQAIAAALGRPQDTDYKQAREKQGVGFDVSTRNKKIGTVLGALGSDITQDSLRRFYWLLNAAQATGDIIAETAIARARPAEGSTATFGKGYKGSDLYSIDPATKKRKYGPGMVQAISIPAGVAINTGLGLMTPFGGAEGYKAALPSEEDPTKTSNVLGEVALKYFMGRTGNLLPYDEFVKVRPDVSPEEYRRYKAFKFDKKEDINPFDDGQASVAAGALRFTDEGIHGPEVQFLGRSLPITTGVVPFAGAVAGGALGVSRLGPKSGAFGSDKPIRRGVAGSIAGLLGGQVAGNIIEDERRRRNTVENELDGTLQ
tara:strand:- start:83 stop:1192 length:1110 start_codon:yes stop_codon:yes gene_type:complete